MPSGVYPHRRGKDHPSWRGGYLQQDGYRMIGVPGHPRGHGHGNYVLEHVLIAERALGRPLPEGAQVHHVDQNPSNNAPGNLVICNDIGYHKLLHRRQRAFDACGDASARRCCLCGRYDNQGDIRIPGHSARHRSCHTKRERERRARQRSDET